MKGLPFMYVVICVSIIQVSCQEWKVNFAHKTICAVKQSSVVIPCSFTCPTNAKVTKVFWTIAPEPNKEPTDLSAISDYRGRVLYSEDISNNCTLTLSKVKLTDAREYQPRIISDAAGQKWLEKPGVVLSVTELSVRISTPTSVTEGSEVKMNCSNDCTLEVIWRKDGKDLPVTKGGNNELILISVTVADEGSYSCALRGFEGYPSTPVKLIVTFAPKNTSMTVSPSEDVSVGDTVTLTCSSDANPPVENYTWFKVNEFTPVGSGQQYSITNIKSEDEGQYYCEARNEYGAENSTTVSIIVKDQKLAVFSIIGVIVAGIIVISCAIHMIRRSWKEEISVESQAAVPPSANTARGADDHDQYSTLQPHGFTQTVNPQVDEDEVQYVTVYVCRPGERYQVQPEGATTTIYGKIQHGT